MSLSECREYPLPAAGVGYGASKRREQASSELDARTFAEWKKLTHEGFRTLRSRCLRCGDANTAKEHARLEQICADQRARREQRESDPPTVP